MTSSTDLATQFLALTDAHDWAAREALLTDETEFVTPFGVLRGPAAATAFSSSFIGAFSDARHHVELVVSSDDMSVIEGTWIGTHTQPLPTPNGEAPATGKVITLPFVLVVQAEGDRIGSVRIYLDQLGFLAQLGLVPVPQTA